MSHFPNNQAKLETDTHKAGQIIHLKLVHGIAALLLYSFDTGVQVFGNFTRRLSLDNIFRYFAFAWGEAVKQVLWAISNKVVGDDPRNTRT